MRSGFAPLLISIRKIGFSFIAIAMFTVWDFLFPVPASAQTYAVLYDFCSLQNCSDGVKPNAALIQGSDGAFYGTTPAGANNAGDIFKITPSGSFTVLYSFCSQGGNCSDGSQPLTALVEGSDGDFYGTTHYGGANNSSACNQGCGTIFKITPSGTLTTIYSFCSQTNCADGFVPSSLVQGSDGNFYGTTAVGGSNVNCLGSGCGTAFKITPGGTYTVLHEFCSQAQCTDGALPSAALVQGVDGNLYGTTQGGGTGNQCGYLDSPGCGTVFRITPGGALTVLYSFVLSNTARTEASHLQRLCRL